MSLSKLMRSEIERTPSTSDSPNLHPEEPLNPAEVIPLSVPPQKGTKKAYSEASLVATESHLAVYKASKKTRKSKPKASRIDPRSITAVKTPTWASLSRTQRKDNSNLLSDASLVNKSLEFYMKIFNDDMEEFPAYERVSEEELLWSYHLLEYDRRFDIGMQRRPRNSVVDDLLPECTSLEDTLIFLNMLPENPSSLKMELRVRGQLSTKQMESLVRNKVREIVVPLSQEYAELKQRYDDLELQYDMKPDDVDICARSILLIHKMRDLSMDIIVWNHIGNLKIILDKAYFFQVNTVTGLQVIASNADIEAHLYDITPELVKQEIIKRITAQFFLAPNKTGSFEIEPCPT